MGFILSAFTKLSFKFKLGLGIAAILLAFGGGWYIHGVFYDAGRVKELETLLKAQTEEIAKYNLKAGELEKELAEERKQSQKLNQELKNEIKKPDYNCAIPVNGKLLYNKALASR